MVTKQRCGAGELKYVHTKSLKCHAVYAPHIGGVAVVNQYKVATNVLVKACVGSLVG